MFNLGEISSCCLVGAGRFHRYNTQADPDETVHLTRRCRIVANCTGLLNLNLYRLRGFESLHLRQQKRSPSGDFFVGRGNWVRSLCSDGKCEQACEHLPSPASPDENQGESGNPSTWQVFLLKERGFSSRYSLKRIPK